MVAKIGNKVRKTIKQRKKVKLQLTRNRQIRLNLLSGRQVKWTIIILVMLSIVYVVVEPLRLYIDNGTTPSKGLDKNAVSDLAWARQRLGYIKSQLDDVTGLKISSSWDNGCSLQNDEEWLNKTKNCSTGIIGKYTVTSQAQAKSVESDIERLVSSPSALIFGDPLTVQDYENFFIYNKNDMDCGWNFNPTGPSLQQIPNGRQTEVEVDISCTVTTTKQIYPEQD
jgi:hypothetical protein